MKTRTAAHNTGLNAGADKEASYCVRHTVKEAKHCYWVRAEALFQQSDLCQMWHGLRNITNFKSKNIESAHADSDIFLLLLCFALSCVYTSHVANEVSSELMERSDVINITECDVRRALQHVSTRKSPGPDGNIGPLLRRPAYPESSPPSSTSLWLKLWSRLASLVPE